MKIDKLLGSDKIVGIKLEEDESIPIFKKDYKMLYEKAKSQKDNVYQDDLNVDDIMARFVSEAIYNYCRNLEEEEHYNDLVIQYERFSKEAKAKRAQKKGSIK